MIKNNLSNQNNILDHVKDECMSEVIQFTSKIGDSLEDIIKNNEANITEEVA
jgi:hypothetical protein